MADSVPDPKLDDVLSSVRRLVSQEIPKRQPPKSPVDAGALVLTSQDRIEVDAAARAKERTLEQRIAELEAAVDRGTEEFEPDGSEDQAQHIPDRIVYTRPRPSEEGVTRRNSTLRLSEIALIETGSTREVETTSDAPIEFRRGGVVPVGDAPKTDVSPTVDIAPTADDAQTAEDTRTADVAPAAEDAPAAEEAPMAEDVPTLPPVSAEVRAFSDPDDVVARIEARIERGGDAETPDPEPASETLDEAAFDAELTAAVRASVAEVVREQPSDTDRLEAALLNPGQSEAVEEDVPGDAVPAPETKSALGDTSAEPADALEAADPKPATGDDDADPEPEMVDDGAEPVVLSTAHVVTRILEPEGGDVGPQLPEQPEPVKPASDEAETAEKPVAEVAEEEAQDDGAASSSGQVALASAEHALDALPDEDAMRLLVSRLIREELQGDLGERITRNVRKLVRREVLRLMDSRDLE